MKIVYLNGCNYSMEIDGTEFVDLSKEEQREVCSRIIDSGKCSSSSLRKFYTYYMECDKGEDIEEVSFKSIAELEEQSKAILYQTDCSECTMQTLVESFLEDKGCYKDLGYCETCGSYNEEYTISI